MKIGVVCNFHAERFALPGFIATAARMFDEVVLVSSPPESTPHDDASLEIVEARGHRLVFDTVADGFGALRTRCIGYSSCDWVVVLDADERVWPSVPRLTCEGSEKWPDVEEPNLCVDMVELIDQHKLLRDIIAKADSEDCYAVCLSRRHWFGPPGVFEKPCQNWQTTDADWQLRCVKNSPKVFYDPEHKMHEKLLFSPTWSEPKYLRGDTTNGPFIDHHSHHFRAMEPEQNTEDIRTYEQLAPGCTKAMWISHQPRS